MSNFPYNRVKGKQHLKEVDSWSKLKGHWDVVSNWSVKITFKQTFSPERCHIQTASKWFPRAVPFYFIYLCGIEVTRPLFLTLLRNFRSTSSLLLYLPHPCIIAHNAKTKQLVENSCYLWNFGTNSSIKDNITQSAHYLMIAKNL